MSAPTLEDSKLERAAYIVAMVLADTAFMAEAAEAIEAADRGEGTPWEQIKEEYGL